MPAFRNDRHQVYDHKTGDLIVDEPVQTDVTVEVVESDLHDKLRQLLGEAAEARAICDGIQAKDPVTLTNLASAQTAMRDMQRDVVKLSQVTEGLVRRLVAVARLTVGALDDNADT